MRSLNLYVDAYVRACAAVCVHACVPKYIHILRHDKTQHCRLKIRFPGTDKHRAFFLLDVSERVPGLLAGRVCIG